ncbi:MAG: type IV pilus biogenesis/stability protein PilW [Xanthomonadales bacterium]|nr:type IV pilus biogenesis/stability protein PilW [Xanthomonadales bacterium]
MNMPTIKELKSIQICWPAVVQFCAVFIMLLLLIGCASTQDEDPWEEGAKRKSAESNTSMGLEYMKRGQYEIALGKLKKAVRDDPGYAPAYTVTAVLYERIGESDLAGVNYKKAFEADRKDGDTNNNYGVFLCKSGDADLAMEHFLKSLEDPFYSTPEVALSNAGSCAMAEEDFAVADEYLRAALKIDPRFPDALINMARLSYRQNNNLKSRAFMQRYEAVTAHDAITLLLAIQIETAAGDRKAASRYLLMLESNFPESDQAAEARRMTGR